MSNEQNSEKFAIRFGLGAIKAVGFNMMENAVAERKKNGKFKDVYDFAERLDPRSINKKSIEALAKSGAFDSIHKSRCQVAESFDILSSYAVQKKEAASSNQMSLFGAEEQNQKPELKKVLDWNKVGRLQKEFEAFGFFLNEHPLDDYVSELKKRGAIFSDKLERDELEDGNLVKMPGVIAGSKHRSGGRGRFAYLTVSDPFGIFEAMIFDEALITSARDILVDGSVVVLECLIRKDEGGVRILVRDVKKLDDFLQNVTPREKDFEDIQKQFSRSNNNRTNYNREAPRKSENPKLVEKSAPLVAATIEKKIISKVEILIEDRTALLSIKSLLTNRIAVEQNEKSTQVFFSIFQNENISKIELPQKFLLDENDILRFRNISGIKEVKIS
jgi:DNA polymerase III alpha subunit